MNKLVADLQAEQEALHRFLITLRADQWDLPSPAEGWSIKDSVIHIAFIDEVAVSVLRGDTTPLDDAKPIGVDRYNTASLAKGRSLKPAEVLPWWQSVRTEMNTGLLNCEPQRRIPWFAMPMGARSFATARLMETWAHGLDCFDTVGAAPEDTDRLRHIALLAYMARSYAYQVNGLQVPSTPFRLELVLPSGTLWSQGDAGAKDLIRGRASDFCRVAVRRRHWRDTDLYVEGDEARRFIEIVQAYAGSPGSGRKPQK
jgi:uncharacterized protein (TIGR03084 family)